MRELRYRGHRAFPSCAPRRARRAASARACGRHELSPSGKDHVALALAGLPIGLAAMVADQSLGVRLAPALGPGASDATMTAISDPFRPLGGLTLLLVLGAGDLINRKPHE